MKFNNFIRALFNLSLFQLGQSTYTFINKRDNCVSSVNIVSTMIGNPYFSVLPLDPCPVCPNTNVCNSCNAPISEVVSVRNTRFWSKILLGFELSQTKKDQIKSCKLKITPVPDQTYLSSNTIVDIYTTESFDPNTVTWDNSPKDKELIFSLNTTNNVPIDVTKYCKSENTNLFFSIVKNDLIGPENIQFYSTKSNSPPTLIIDYD